MLSKLEQRNEQGHRRGGPSNEFQRCELCNVPIYHNPCRDIRSLGVFQGKGKILCNKCSALLSRMPSEQALQALNNAYETYGKKS